MQRIKWKRLALTLALCSAWCAGGMAEPRDDVGPAYIGRLKPKHAREIEASNWSVGAETMDRDYTIYRHWREHLGPLGFKKARIQGGWAKTEQRKGEYDFAWLDEIVFDMTRQGVEPWMCLCYGNPLYAGGGGTRLGAKLPSAGASLAAWKRWVRATVERYQNHIDEWEVWNEPNLRGANAAQDYATLLIETAETVRAVQPKAKILGLSTAGVKVDYTRSVLTILKEKGKLDLVDQITYHPYKPNPDSSSKEVLALRHRSAGSSARPGASAGSTLPPRLTAESQAPD